MLTPPLLHYQRIHTAPVCQTLPEGNLTDYVYDGPQYPDPFFEVDELYWLAGHRYHVLAVADTKFGRLAWATMQLDDGKIDAQTLVPAQFAEATHIPGGTHV